MLAFRSTIQLAGPALFMSIAAPAQDDFCESPIGASHLLTPGTATCEAMGQTTTVTLFDDTEISWNPLALPAGHRLEFAFANPQHTVVNRSLGTAVFPNTQTRIPTFIEGALVSNGNVVILSPNNSLQFSRGARIEAASFTASGLDADTNQFFSNSAPLEFAATERSSPVTFIDGHITTTRGDVVLVGKELHTTADIDSTGAVTAVTGTNVRLDRSGRVLDASGGTNIIHGGTITAEDDIEFAAQQVINMVGEMVPGRGRGQFFARVDDSGAIQIGDAGLTIRGTHFFSTPEVGEVAFIDPDEGDNPGARSPAVNEFPVLGDKKVATRTRPTSAPVTARASSTFTRERDNASERRRKLANSSLPVIRKQAFFRSRTTLTKRGN